jgi:7-cyano-7-deazaguanine synthase
MAQQMNDFFPGDEPGPTRHPITPVPEGGQSDFARGGRAPRSAIVGLLASGGLDSSILLSHLLAMGARVKPFYIRSGLRWQAVEEASLVRYLDGVRSTALEPLSALELPLADVYGDHWSITGNDTPGAATSDEAVFLPGRNVLLTVKAALWCQTHGIQELALATLCSNPFPDATQESLDRLSEVLSGMLSRPIRLVRPFGRLDKRQVMQIGRELPLHMTFSCIAPDRGIHCGRCNKCAERQAAFRLVDRMDKTEYAVTAGDLWH